MKALISILLALSACGDHTNGAPPSNAKPVEASCSTQAAELKTYLTSVLDATATPAPPWPTGDAVTDKKIEDARAMARAEAKPVDPAAKAKPLSAGVAPGSLEYELASCAPARDKLSKVGDAPPAQAATAYAELADGIEACDCKVNVPLVRALMYITQRGPDVVAK